MVVLLASEWVEVGSGLAEISLTVDTWGQRLLAVLLEVGGRCDRGVGRVDHALLLLFLILSLLFSYRIFTVYMGFLEPPVMTRFYDELLYVHYFLRYIMLYCPGEGGRRAGHD